MASSYIDSNLIEGEEVIHRGSLSLWPFALRIFMGVLLIPVVGIGLIILLSIWLKIRSTEIAVTNRRLVVKVGVVSRDTMEITLGRVESIDVHQSPMGLMLGYGSIRIRGTGSSNDPIDNIKAPLEFRNAFTRALDQYAGRLGSGGGK